MKSIEKIKDKEQTIYNFSKDVIAEGGEFLIPYKDTYHLYFKVVCFYLYEIWSAQLKMSVRNHSLKWVHYFFIPKGWEIIE